jgi:hypothetical protein
MNPGWPLQAVFESFWKPAGKLGLKPETGSERFFGALPRFSEAASDKLSEP